MTLIRPLYFLLICLSAIILLQPACPAQADNTLTAESSSSPPQLNRTIDEVITRPEFSWRLPRETIETSEENGLLVDFLDEIRAMIKKTAKRSEKYLKRFAEWMEDIFGHRARKTTARSGSGFDWQMLPRILLILLLAATACIACIVIIRLIRKRQRMQKTSDPGMRFSTPNLKEENITADQLETDAWLELAEEMRRQGEYRLAARAQFLAGLAHLAEQHYISIARFKSNREYNRELIRRARDQQFLIDLFAQCVFFFESAWYGTNPVTPENLSGYTTNINRIIHDF